MSKVKDSEEVRCHVCMAMERSKEVMEGALDSKLMYIDDKRGRTIERERIELAGLWLAHAITMAQSHGHEEGCPRLAKIIEHNKQNARDQMEFMKELQPEVVLPGEKKVVQ